MSTGSFKFYVVRSFSILFSLLYAITISLRKSSVFVDISLFDQVGISESGIDDAVQKLIARG